MDVNNVMSTYNLNSLWNNINPNKSASSGVPLINSVDAAVNQNYAEMKLSGQTNSTELQDIYQQVEPNYGISLTYDQNGNMTIPTSTTLPTDITSTENSNIISLLNSGNSSMDNSLSNIVSQYDSIENGTFKPDPSSLLSSNSSTLYNTSNLLGNNVDTTV